MIDRREELALLPLSDAAVNDLLVSMPDEKRNEYWWFVLRDGTPIPGDGGGSVALMNEIRLTRWIGRLLAVLRLSPSIDVLDRFVARQRGQLSQFVPQGPAPRRFP